jgi:prepilin-type N-terminal cleavage/methylation domain-containing protein
MKTNPRPPVRRRSGFTLIELMAVITSIVIHAGLVVGCMGFVSERQAE